MSRPCLEQDSASLPLDIPKHPERDDDGAYASAPSWKLKLGHRTTPRLSAYAHCFETAKSRTLDRCAGYKHCRKLLYTYWLLQGQTNDTVQTPEPHFQTRTRHSKIHQHGFKNHNLNQKILGNLIRAPHLLFFPQPPLSECSGLQPDQVLSHLLVGFPPATTMAMIVRLGKLQENKQHFLLQQKHAFCNCWSLMVSGGS